MQNLQNFSTENCSSHKKPFKVTICDCRWVRYSISTQYWLSAWIALCLRQKHYRNAQQAESNIATHVMQLHYGQNNQNIKFLLKLYIWKPSTVNIACSCYHGIINVFLCRWTKRRLLVLRCYVLCTIHHLLNDPRRPILSQFNSFLHNHCQQSQTATITVWHLNCHKTVTLHYSRIQFITTIWDTACCSFKFIM